jgi:hypothetical protein
MGTMQDLIEGAGKPQDGDTALIRNVKARGAKAADDAQAAVKSITALVTSLALELPKFTGFHGWPCELMGAAFMGAGGDQRAMKMTLLVTFVGDTKPSEDVWRQVADWVKGALAGAEKVDVKREGTDIVIEAVLGSGRALL